MADDKKLERRKATTAIIAVTVVAGMVGFAFASVPLYRLVCTKLGIGGTTQVAATAPKVVSQENVTVSFFANTDPALPWEFKPEQKAITLKIGETATIKYRAKNLSDHTIVGTATFNVTPEKVGIYFNKLACFCFQETTLKPGEEVELPVTFFVDPDLLQDEYANEVRALTLSYTFFPSLNAVAAAPAATVSK
jgi:cytochrome c oxidase assembly protein subunit 11